MAYSIQFPVYVDNPLSPGDLTVQIFNASDGSPAALWDDINKVTSSLHEFQITDGWFLKYADAGLYNIRAFDDKNNERWFYNVEVGEFITGGNKNAVQFFVTGSNPIVPASVTVEVFDATDDTPASIWEEASGTTAISGGTFAVTAGHFIFYTDPGRYDIKVSNGTEISWLRDIEVGAWHNESGKKHAFQSVVFDGDPLEPIFDNVTVRVTHPSTGNDATIFSDFDGSQLANPFAVSDAFFRFYADADVYNIDIYRDGVAIIQYKYVPIGAFDPVPISGFDWGPLPRYLNSGTGSANHGIVIQGDDSGNWMAGFNQNRFSRSIVNAQLFVSMPPQDLNSGASVGNPISLRWLHDDVWIATFLDGWLARTDDGGDTWTALTRFANTSSSNDPIKDIAYGNGVTIFVLQDGWAARSTDDGDNMTELTRGLNNAGGDSLSINSVDTNGAGLFIAVLDSGYMVISNDAGATFANLGHGLGINPTWQKIRYCGNQTWIVVGTGASAAITTDDGTTWSTLAGSITITLGVIQALTTDKAGTVIAGNDRGEAMISFDYGATWAELTQYLNSGAGGFLDIADLGYSNGIWCAIFHDGWAAISPPLWSQVLFPSGTTAPTEYTYSDTRISSYVMVNGMAIDGLLAYRIENNGPTEYEVKYFYNNDGTFTKVAENVLTTSAGGDLIRRIPYDSTSVEFFYHDQYNDRFYIRTYDPVNFYDRIFQRDNAVASPSNGWTEIAAWDENNDNVSGVAVHPVTGHYVLKKGTSIEVYDSADSLLQTLGSAFESGAQGLDIIHAGDGDLSTSYLTGANSSTPPFYALDDLIAGTLTNLASSTPFTGTNLLNTTGPTVYGGKLLLRWLSSGHYNFLMFDT